MNLFGTRTIILSAMVGIGFGADLGWSFSKPFGSAPAPQVVLSCAPPTHAAGSPRFAAVPPGMAEYTFRGLCRGSDGRDYVSYWSSGTWTPGQRDPANANASETYRIELNEAVWPTRAPGPRGDGVLTFIFGARCDRDPWLHRDAQCRAIGNNVPDDVKAAWPEIVQAPFPRSRLAIGEAEQRRLRVAYERANPVVRTSDAARATVKTGTSSLDASRIAAGSATLRAPRIVIPEPGSRASTRVRVQATTPAGFDQAAAEVVLTWVPARPRDNGQAAAQAPAPLPSFATTTRELAQGIVLPPGATPTQSGTWTIKVRTITRDGAGAWSDAVAFVFEAGSAKSLQTSAAKYDAAALNPQPLPPRFAGQAAPSPPAPMPGALRAPIALSR